MKSQKKSLTPLERALGDYKAGNYQAALITLAESQVSEAEYIDVAYILGLCYVRLCKYDEALLYLEQVVTAGVENARTVQCRKTLAFIYSITGRNKLAEYELKKLVDTNYSEAAVYAGLGFSSWAQGHAEEALQWYTKALTMDSENLNAMNGLGYVLACMDRDLSRALTLCRKALDGDPGNPAYADSLGWAYVRLGMFEDAERYLEFAVTAMPENEEALYHREQLRKALGR